MGVRAAGLTAAGVKSMPPGRYGDGDGLYSTPAASAHPEMERLEDHAIDQRVHDRGWPLIQTACLLPRMAACPITLNCGTF